MPLPETLRTMRPHWPSLSEWQSLPARMLRVWRRSLQVRTVTITIIFTGVAIVITGIYTSLSIANDLYESRLSASLTDSSRATTVAQSTINASDVSAGDVGKNLLDTALEAVQETTSSRLIAAYRVPGQSSVVVPPPDRGSPALNPVISSQLRKAVERGSGKQYYQSVGFTQLNGSVTPGLVVGTQLLLPSYGAYELYIGYDLSDVQSTLEFIQNTLIIAGFALVLLIGAITWLIVRFVVEPIRVAARTSERLAAGELTVRIPEHGDDVFATLARSFNDMADSLQSQITQLAELSRLQQRFVSDVSHELRTPLTTIRLADDVLYDKRESFTPETARTAELLHDQVARFDHLLADLLEISRYDAGSVVLDAEPTNLVRVTEDVADDLRALAHQNGTELIVRAPGGYVDVVVDQRRIRRVLRNFIGNAIEHGEGRPIVITVDSNRTAVSVTVRDYGIGMNEEELGHVFDRFWRADPSRRRTLGGSGLGLAISREDATVHSGRVEVWSAPSLGSSFRLTLPREPGALIEVAPLPLTPEDAGRRAVQLTEEPSPEMTIKYEADTP